MKRYISLLLAIILLLSSLASCKNETPTNTQTTAPETTAPEPELRKPMPYPNALDVSAYNMLTDKEKEIYENIARILASPTPGKVYEIKKKGRITSFDMLTDILRANFTPYNDILDNIDFELDGGKISSVKLDDSFDIEAFNKKNDALMKKADEIVSEIPKDLSQKEVVFEIIDYLVSSIDFSRASQVNDEYSALVQGKGGPTGLSNAFTLLCKKAGLDCISVYGFEEKHHYDINTNKSEHWFEITDPKVYWNIVRIDNKWYNVNLESIHGLWADGFENFINLDNVFRSYYSAYYFYRTDLDNMLTPTVSRWNNIAYEFTSCKEVIKLFENMDVHLNYLYSNDYPFAVRFKDLSEAEKFAEYNEKLIYDKSGKSYYIYTNQDFYEDDGKTVRFYLILNATGEEMKANLKYNEFEYSPTFAVYPDSSSGWEVHGVSILFEVPYTWSPANHLNAQFQRFINSEYYTGIGHAMVFNEFIGIDESFVFNEKLKYSIARPGNEVDPTIPEMGVNSHGVEYASYLQELEDEVFGQVYMKISDKYIVTIEFCEHTNNRDIIEKVIDSVRIK